MAAAVPRPRPGTVLRLLRLSGYSILRQLQLEEGLMRASNQNWFIVNDGTPLPTIVLGVSGKPEELVHLEAAAAQHVPLIKRFTGGGTVVVDRDTVFTALILGGGSAWGGSPGGVEPYPRPIMQYTEHLYRPVFDPHGPFRLRENDYCFGAVKFGGNAQAITKDRWVHHTSLLWDFQPQRMQLLKQPAKQPEYRQDRGHLEFVAPLREAMPSRRGLIDALCASLEGAGFRVAEVGLGEAEAAAAASTLCGTRLLDAPGLLAAANVFK